MNLHPITTKALLVGGEMDGQEIDLPPSLIFPMSLTSVVHHRGYKAVDCYHIGPTQGVYEFHARRIIDVDD